MSIAIFMDSGKQTSDPYTNHKTAKSAPPGALFYWKCFSGKLEIQAEQAEVQKQDDRYADHKSCMSGFMAKDEHSGKCADASADQCKKHECTLRDAPPFADCPALVCVIYEECDDIDRQQPERHEADDIMKN